jgi:hypothetical protein
MFALFADRLKTAHPGESQSGSQWRPGPPLSVPDGEDFYVIGARKVVDVVPTVPEENSANARYGRPSIQATNIRCLADELKGRREFVCK